MPCSCQGVDNRLVFGAPEYQKPYDPLPAGSCRGCQGSWFDQSVFFPGEITVETLNQQTKTTSKLTRQSFS